jgi:hypothetical protein
MVHWPKKIAVKNKIFQVHFELLILSGTDLTKPPPPWSESLGTALHTMQVLSSRFAFICISSVMLVNFAILVLKYESENLSVIHYYDIWT